MRRSQTPNLRQAGDAKPSRLSHRYTWGTQNSNRMNGKENKNDKGIAGQIKRQNTKPNAKLSKPS